MATYTTWKEKPSQEDVEKEIRLFFKKLKEGDIDGAGAMVAHSYDDWNDSVYVLWQETYQIYETPQDKSLEGEEWKKNAAWLFDLDINGDLTWEGDSTIYVSLQYKGNPIDHVGTFFLRNEDNVFFVERESIQIG